MAFDLLTLLDFFRTHGAATHGFQLSRPHGAVITKRNRGPRPVRRGFGQLHGWLEVAEPAGWGLTDRRPTFQFAGGELGWYTLKRRRRHFAEINGPLCRLERERSVPTSCHLPASDAPMPPSRQTPSSNPCNNRSLRPGRIAAPQSCPGHSPPAVSSCR